MTQFYDLDKFENSKNSTGNKGKKIDKNLDTFIGKKIREKRISLGMTQSKLGSYLGITFQQVQKYERGTNRISSSMLYVIASIFRVNLQWFVEGFQDNRSDAVGDMNMNPAMALNEGSEATYDTEAAKDRDFQALLKAFWAIPNIKTRKKVLGIVKAFAPTKDKNHAKNVKKK